MQRAFTAFFLVFSTLHLTLTGYIGLRLIENAWEFAILLALGLLLWSLPLAHWHRNGESETSGIKLFFHQTSYVSMVVLSWLLVLTIARDLLLFAIYVATVFFSEAAFSYEAKLLELWNSPLIFGMAFLLTLIGSWRALRGPRVKYISIPSGRPELANFKIAQITDLHIGPTIGRNYVQKVVDMIAALTPDITVLTGDIVDGSVRDHKNSIEPFLQLIPRGSLFLSMGNHEYYHGVDQWLPELERLGLNILLNRGEFVTFKEQKIWIGGITDPAGAQMKLGETPDVMKALSGSDSAAFRILLSHRPGFADAAQKAGFDLQLSGHTHGGQFFPWIYVARFFHRYLHGLFNHENMWVYVSPGTGTWGPPARLGTTSEVTLLEFT